MINVDELQQKLSDMIRNYVETTRHKSFLARKTGITIPTIEKYLQNEYSNRPTVDVVFPLLSFFSTPYNAAQELKSIFPSWWEHTGKYLAPKTETSSAAISWTKVHAEIFAKSFSPNGVSDAWIKEHFGKNIGFEVRDELLKANYIEMRSGLYFKTVKNSIDLNIQSVLNQIATHAETFPKEQIEHNEDQNKNGAYLHIMTTIPQEGREQVFNILRASQKKIKEIVDTYTNSSTSSDERFKMSILFDWEKNF